MPLYVPQEWEDGNAAKPPSGARFAHIEAGVEKASIVIVTALPGSPAHGDEVYYEVESGLLWHLVYDSTIVDDYKWVATGAQPLRAAVATLEVITGNLYVNLATDGPLVTVPLDGLYYGIGKATLITLNNTALYTGSVGLGLNDFTSGNAHDFTSGTAVQVTNAQLTAFVQAEIEAAAGDDIKLRYGMPPTASNMSVSKRQLAVWPLRVG